MRRVVLLMALLAAGAAGSARAAEPGPTPVGQPAPALQPYVAVRSLQAVQDQVARGSAVAQSALPALLAHIADAFAAAGPEAWKDPRNTEAAALFLFSAGSPDAVRKALAGAELPPAGRTLLDGALAYAEGRDDRARQLLGTLAPRSLSRALGGHLALVLASLYAETDPRKAGDMLNEARLLVPGTLVEEAALRRQIFLLAQPASADRFASLSRQYLRRFRASVFAGNFKARLRSFASDLAAAGDVTALAKLDPVIGDLAAAEARALYLSLARQALVQGRVEAARFAAVRAAGYSPTGAEAARVSLYTAAAQAVTEDAAAAGRALAAIDPNGLGPDDAALRTAAIAVASSVDPVPSDEPGGPSVAARPDPATNADAAPLIARAEGSLAAADALLRDAP